jgi:histone deacetylase HOS3
MSQHGCYVPVSFYHRFTRAACTFADEYAQGRLVSILEGGYSNRALISGVMSHISGLAEDAGIAADEEWWNLNSLIEVRRSAFSM